MRRWQWKQIIALAACLCLSGCGRMPPADPPRAAPVAAISAAGLGRQELPDPPEEDPPEPEAEPESKPEPEAPRTDWWTIPVIAHALGTVDGRRETNSLDAFLESYEAGHRVFEVDLQLTSDGHLIARHDWEQISYYNLEQKFAGVMDRETFLHTPVCYFYTPLDVDGLVALLQDYPDAYLVTDSKDTGEETVRAQIRELARAIEAAGDPDLWERIIVQIYHEDMYAWVSEEAPVTNWIFTLYQIVTPDYEEIGTFCRDHDIPVVTISAERLTEEHVRILHSYDRRIYVHTVNRLRSMEELSWGADGFYSDYVSPGELEAVLAGDSKMRIGSPYVRKEEGGKDAQKPEKQTPEDETSPDAQTTDK